MTYEQWQGHFGKDMASFNGYTDTTTVTVQIGTDIPFRDILDMDKGAIGVDLPVWYNYDDASAPRVMIVAQDPLRSKKWYGTKPDCFCQDAVLSTPFATHDFEHRNGNGKRMALLIAYLIQKKFGVYLTDARKYFIDSHKTSEEYAHKHSQDYKEIFKKELEVIQPDLIVSFGKAAETACVELLGTSGMRLLPLPHIAPTANGAIKRYFRTEEKLTAERVAALYGEEILSKIKKCYF